MKNKCNMKSFKRWKLTFICGFASISRTAMRAITVFKPSDHIDERNNETLKRRQPRRREEKIKMNWIYSQKKVK